MEGRKDFPQPSTSETGFVPRTEQDYVDIGQMSSAQKAVKVLVDLEIARIEFKQKRIDLDTLETFREEVYQMLLQMRDAKQLEGLRRESRISYMRIEKIINTHVSLPKLIKDRWAPDVPSIYRRADLPWAMNPDNPVYIIDFKKRLKEDLGIDPDKYPTFRDEIPKAPTPVPKVRPDSPYRLTKSTFEH